METAYKVADDGYWHRKEDERRKPDWQHGTTTRCITSSTLKYLLGSNASTTVLILPVPPSTCHRIIDRFRIRCSWNEPAATWVCNWVLKKMISESNKPVDLQDVEGECNTVTEIVSCAVVTVFASVYNCYLGVLQPYLEYPDGNDI